MEFLPRLRSWTVASLAGAGLLGACASPPPQFYTLAAPENGPVTQATQGTTSNAAQDAAFSLADSVAAFSLQPIRVPAQVDQSNVLVRTGANELTPDYNARWAAALGEDIETALASHLRQAGLLDLTDLGGQAGSPLWRLQVQITTFDLPQSGPTTLEALWRARQVGQSDQSQPAILCSFQQQEPSLSPAIADLVAAQRLAVAALGQQIAEVLKTGKPAANCSQAGDA